MHSLALAMLRQHRVCVYSKITDYLLKLYTFRTFDARLSVFGLRCKYFLLKI